VITGECGKGEIVMKIKQVTTFCAAMITLGIGVTVAQAPNNPPPPRAGLTITASEFPDGGVIPAKFTRTVENPVSPKLEWKNILPNAVSFTLIVHDPDTSRSKTTEDVLHWMIVNLPADAREIAEGVGTSSAVKLPNGAMQMKNRTGAPGYVAMAAGTGPYHHYLFELYELDTKLDVGPEATRAEVLKAMDGHVIEKGVTFGRFRREK
jgi:Raf kinase inhibitor-like YbhB/YbcL family protein